jgi:hypothetical protein
MAMANALRSEESNPIQLAQTNRLRELVEGLPQAQPLAYRFSGLNTSLPALYTDAPHSTWGLCISGMAQAKGAQDLYEVVLRELINHYAPSYCSRWSNNDWAATAIICVYACPTCSKEVAPAAAPTLTAIAPPDYPLATFIQPANLGWDEDFFAAEQAAKIYLKEFHADH